MFWGEKSQILSTFKKMKNPKVFTERPYTQKIKFERFFFRKDPPQLLLMYISKTQNYKAQLLQLSTFPNLASEMLRTSYPSKN